MVVELPIFYSSQVGDIYRSVKGSSNLGKVDGEAGVVYVHDFFFLMTIVRFNCVFVHKALGTFPFFHMVRKRTWIAGSSFGLPALRRVPMPG